MSLTAMREQFWADVHSYLPCWAIHLLCSLCRTEEICPKCWERRIGSWGGYAMSPEDRAREEAESGVPIGLLNVPPNNTFSTAQTVTFTISKGTPS